MTNMTINGVSVGAVAVLPIKTGVSAEAALKAVQKNGLDEVIFEKGGAKFVAYGDDLNFKGLKKGTVPSSTLDGQVVSVLAVDNEVNSVGEGVKKQWKKAAVAAGTGVVGGSVLAGVVLNAARNISKVGPGAPIIGGLLAGGGLATAAVVAGAGVLTAGAFTAYGAIKGGKTSWNMDGLHSISR